METIIKKIGLLVTIFSCSVCVQAQCEYEEKDGLVIIEAENTTSNYNEWILKTDVEDYKGSGHLEFTGNTTTNGPASSPLTYTFKINQGGMYQLTLRARKRITPPDESDKSNDCYVRIEGDYDASPDAGDNHNDDAPKSALLSDTKIYGGNTDSWGWAVSLDLGGDTNKRFPKYVFKAGETYTLVMSGRSKQFNVDRFIFYRLDDYSTANARNAQNTIEETICEQEAPVTPENVTLSGELKRWHKITLDFEGPNTSETASTNPFSDYRLDVTFTNGSKSYVVPGYYSGCSNPEDTSCDSGNIWKVNFAPDRTGTWNWTASFKTGSDVAVNGGGSSVSFDGVTGSFSVAESDKAGRDFRSANLGRLQYVGEHYLKHSGTTPDNPNGPWFLKAGADSPENTFAYEDFDNTPNRGNRRKAWEPHQQDYIANEASDYTWDSGKGSELLGVVNYLSSEGANSMSFLTFSLGGDDENIFPHLLKVSESVYNGYEDDEQWSNGVHKDRFDVSKMAQWEKIFEYADKKGVYLHFKTMETENDNFMDNNENGRERKLYYRELIARFGHHLALNWNLTEETTLDSDVAIDITEYIHEVDPYDHNIVIHTYPSQKSQRYTPLLGNNSELTGASLQSNSDDVHDDVITWINNSANAGKKWVVANDEQGPANLGVRIDDEDIREKVLYGTLMAGGAGVEYYYGYTSTDGDLNNQNHRLRGVAYEEAGYALDFFNTYLQDDLIDMESSDSVTADNNDYVFAKEGELYAVYRPNGGTTDISLPTGDWTVQWYNPRIGGNLTAAEAINGSLVAPNTNDWVALITGEGVDTGCVNTAAFIEAECFDDMSGVQNETSTENNLNVGYINNGDWMLYENIDLTGMQSIEARVACNFDGGDIEIRIGGTTGELIGTLPVVNTGGNQEWVTISGNIEEINGSQDLYLVFTGEGNGYLFNINYFRFSTEAVLSIDEVKTVPSKVSIYPNPVISNATIQNAAKSSINVYDTNGKMILSKPILSDDETIDMSKLATGTYYTEVVNSDSTSMVKLIKE